MIGKIYVSMVEFYDAKNQKNSIKARPVLILSNVRNNDFTVLPISTISNTQNIDLDYDIEVNPQIYQNLNLKKISYIRTHKQTVTHRASITKVIINVKKMYPALYTRVIDKVEEKYKINIIEARS